MYGKIKKIISTMLAVTAMTSVGLAFVGCDDGKYTEQPIDEDKNYVIVTDNYGNSYEFGSGRNYTVTLDYDESKNYQYSYEVYYSDTGALANSSHLFFVNGNAPGTYTKKITIPAKKSNTVLWTQFTVVVNENPLLTPDVSFDPNGAIDYVENERYIYKYDGQRHYPLLKLSYQNVPIDFYFRAPFGIIPVEETESVTFSERMGIGEYRIIYNVPSNYYENDKDKEQFKGISVEVIVEIVE